MKHYAKRLAASTLTVAMIIGMVSIASADSDNSIKSVNAGVTTSFEPSYYEEASQNIKAPTVSENEVNVTATEAQQCVAGYNNIGIANVDGHLNVRKDSSGSGEVVGKMPSEAACEILGQEGEWYLIESGKVKGYVSAEFLLTGDAAKEKALTLVRKMAVANTDALRVRQEPNTSCSVIMSIENGEELEMVEDMGDWVKVSVNGDVGYIAKEYVNIELRLKRAVTIEELNYGSGVTSTRVKLVREALKYVGNRYVWGGVSLTKGADCSGYVLSLYKMFGIVLPHSSRAQAGYGRKVNASEAKPGDLFFYGSGSSISHVAIYIGNGQCVHAYDERNGIKVTSAFYRKPITVRSLLD